MNRHICQIARFEIHGYFRIRVAYSSKNSLNLFPNRVSVFIFSILLMPIPRSLDNDTSQNAQSLGAILPFVQSGNVDISSLTGFEPRTLRITVGSFIHYTKFPHSTERFEKDFREILRDFYNLSVTESPVESSNNRRFLSKRQKTRIVNILI